MIVGIPKEIKDNEQRVALTPHGAKDLIGLGHIVNIEQSAGNGSGFNDADYVEVGATILPSLEEIYSTSDLIVKVKEPQPNEVALIKENQLVFTFFHFAADEGLTKGIIDSKSIAIAYETIEASDKSLPILIPMSEVAGRMSVQAGAHCLEKPQGGRGLLIGGAPEVNPGNVLILGGGVVGENAAIIATGMQAKVHIVDKSEVRLKQLSEMFGESNF
jgi:alanine dehydrogenase